MGRYDFEMGSRAAREIQACYVKYGSPLCAMARMKPTVSALHLCVPPPDPQAIRAQEVLGAEHPWFQFEFLAAKSHFPMFEVADNMTSAIEGFLC